MRRDLSVWLDVVRFVAAIAVVLGHSSRFVTPDLPRFVTAHAPEAVAVFFVLSGFVIRHVTSTRVTTLKGYLEARAVRVLSVAIPALVVTLLVDRLGYAFNPQYYDVLLFWDGPLDPIDAMLSLMHLPFLVFAGATRDHWEAVGARDVVVLCAVIASLFLLAEFGERRKEWVRALVAVVSRQRPAVAEVA